MSLNKNGEQAWQYLERITALSVEYPQIFKNLVWWSDVRAGANCSDLFMWASADVEEIKAEDIPLLAECVKHATEQGTSEWSLELFAATKRGIKPMGAVFQRYPKVEGLFEHLDENPGGHYGDSHLLTTEEVKAERGAAETNCIPVEDEAVVVSLEVANWKDNLYKIEKFLSMRAKLDILYDEFHLTYVDGQIKPLVYIEQGVEEIPVVFEDKDVDYILERYNKIAPLSKYMEGLLAYDLWCYKALGSPIDENRAFFNAELTAVTDESRAKLVKILKGG